MYKIIEECSVKISVPISSKISKELPVFYNPIMKFNRDVSILILNTLDKDIQVALPLGGTGVRACRILKETNIKDVSINDINKEAIKIIKKNLKMNKVKAKVSNKDANMFLLESKGFDYIDIDPFGSPNVFLDSAIKRLSRGGVLAVTATDTGCLAGSFINACKRKYWAVPSRNSTMHENGLRILIRKVQLIGADHDKALVPIFSYFKDHYFRVFFRCEKGKKKVDAVIKQHGMFQESGPLWLGKLWDSKLASKLAKSKDPFLKIISAEAKINTVGFYHIPKICKKYKLKQMKQDLLISKVKKKGYKASLTHFALNSIRSDIPLEKFLKLF